MTKQEAMELADTIAADMGNELRISRSDIDVEPGFNPYSKTSGTEQDYGIEYGDARLTIYDARCFVTPVGRFRSVELPSLQSAIRVLFWANDNWYLRKDAE